ncbi:tubulin binding cofactor C-domain-containing protein [Melanogaster broomeanus]|nr:tubulin binding cofactor C-domain-containing protein [Melanogaster broomeanus]
MAESKWTFAQKFCTDFNVTASELATRLDALKSSSIASSDAVQAIASDLSRLTKSLSDATGSLPSYDQRQCELQLKTLEKSTEELRGASTGTPKRPFEPAPTTALPPAQLQSSTPISSAKTLSSFSHRYLTTANFDTKDSSAEVSIADLDSCIVDLLPKGDDGAKITAFHVQRVSRCIFLLPPVTGSILLYDLSECVIVTGCHQFRMHNSSAVDVYLAIEGNPVIEHCSNIRFAGSEDKHFMVQDFSHIRPTPSPNWSALSEEQWERRWPVSELEGHALLKELERMLPARQGGLVE